MATRKLLSTLVASLLIVSTLQDVSDNKMDSQEESPLANIASEILREKNLENIGGVVNSFIQSGGAKQIVDGVLQNLAASGNSGQLLESLGSLLSASEKKPENSEGKVSDKKANGEINPMQILSLLGSLQGGAGNEGQANPASLLQGLGTLLAGNGDNQGGGNNAAALLQGLGTIMSSMQTDKKEEEENNPAAFILQSLGSVLGTAGGQNQGDGPDMGALLQGLGSLLGGEQKAEKPTTGPKANVQRESKASKPNSKTKKKIGSDKPKSRQIKNSPGNSVSSLVSSLVSKQSADKEAFDLSLVYKNFPLILKLARSLGGPNLKQYLDPLDDALELFKELHDKSVKKDFKKILPRLLKIYKAYQELVAPYLKSVSKKGSQDASFDFSGILNVVSSFLSQMNSNEGGGNKRGASFVDYLPMIMNTISAFTGPEAEKRAQEHLGHSSIVPPIIEKIHVYFESFVNSDMGRQFLKYLEKQKAFKVFLDDKGKFNYEKFKELIENHSFRRHWIQQVAAKLVEYLKFFSDENVQKQYVEMSVTFTNSYLKNLGFPDHALPNLKAPAKSITNFVNYAAKKYLDAEIDSKEYVEPVVQYLQDLTKLAKQSLATNELTDKLTDTLNLEIIEPITRVNRAYRFAQKEPKCDVYLFCVLNQESPPIDPGSLPALRKAIYKGYSFVAAWFLQINTGTSYWNLYNVITEKRNCRDFYNDACTGFYDEEVMVTTEYVHNEL